MWQFCVWCAVSMVKFDFNFVANGKQADDPCIDPVDLKIRFYLFRVAGVAPVPCLFSCERLRKLSGNHECVVSDRCGKATAVLLQLRNGGMCRVSVFGDQRALELNLLWSIGETQVRPTGCAVSALPRNPARDVCDVVRLFVEEMMLETPFPAYDARQSRGGPVVRRFSLRRFTKSDDDYFLLVCSGDGKMVHLNLRMPDGVRFGSISSIEGGDCDMLTITSPDGADSCCAVQHKRRDGKGRKVIEFVFDVPETPHGCETDGRVFDVISMLWLYLSAAYAPVQAGDSWV